jgi:hypothetical protein
MFTSFLSILSSLGTTILICISVGAAFFAAFAVLLSVLLSLLCFLGLIQMAALICFTDDGWWSFGGAGFMADVFLRRCCVFGAAFVVR